MELSPMMKQYMSIKEQYKDCILFFRLGDFYEMFFEDAIIASKEMEITLTGKNCGQEERAPMCGVPFHSSDVYIAKLIEKGYKVAICEQTEDPAVAKGIVKREVVQVITPGTVISQTMLNEKENNYLASVFIDDKGVGLSYCDISTGELRVTDINEFDTIDTIINQLVRIKPKEIIINKSAEKICSIEELKLLTDSYVNILEDSYYTNSSAINSILRQFHVKSIIGIGMRECEVAVNSLGALLSYLFETRKQSLSHITQVNYYDIGSYMCLDKATIKNLELTETLYEKKISGSLLGILDKTHTAMGSRKLKQWIKEPLNKAPDIQKRLDAVETLVDDIILRNNIKEGLKRIYDLERLVGRVAFGNTNGKDLIALKNSISILPEIKSDLKNCGNDYLEEIENNIYSLEEIYHIIDTSIVEEPGFTIKEGSLIKSGYSEELDQLKFSIKDGQNWIAGLENIEKERTGIKNIKVGFNKVFGFYIEITRSNYDMIPENYIRKQTLVNCERFITPELKEMESLVLNAEAKINQLEYEIFLTVRSFVQDYISDIQTTSQAIANLDTLISFAEVSAKCSYVKPKINTGDKLIIEKGRHPVIEHIIKDGVFVSNNTYVDCDSSSLLLITGPNMSGKSTYMRQTALIVLMAQIGCFVPCESAEIGIVDRIYTRIGASDNLTQGQSTFYVEMSELAYILNTSTEKSLIILDEIGRGTSTYDGLSIAWAVVEYLCHKQKGTRTLFATHYHELTELETVTKGLKNLNVEVSEENGNIVFLHKIIEGSASRSYGIHVAKLAGVPKSVLEAAEFKLLELEAGVFENKLESAVSKGKNNLYQTDKVEQSGQLSFFEMINDPLVQRIKSLNLMEITPSEAIKILEELKAAAK